jgi:hypothetical protein
MATMATAAHGMAAPVRGSSHRELEGLGLSSSSQLLSYLYGAVGLTATGMLGTPSGLIPAGRTGAQEAAASSSAVASPACGMHVHDTGISIVFGGEMCPLQFEVFTRVLS